MIKSTKGYEGKPLMYIVQPEYRDIKAEMQTLVVKKTKKAEPKAAAVLPEPAAAAEESTELSDTVEAAAEGPAFVRAETEQLTDQTGAESPHAEDRQGILKAELVQEKPAAEEEQSVQRRPRKQVSQMTIAEKVEFVTNLPVNIPRTLCHIELENGSRRGMIVSEVDGIVTIQATTSSQPLKVRMDEIKAIHLLGF
ncbi:spore coat CotO family protein [Metabacillus sp. GX 13764]|uniref:CotO family spore coat protein n=1 Tax=Metabacillus kandeliae TaxID=2900151 RepID=UPI001E4BD24F|nr:spore coat CotO family protein [Metabacillus kandeliae]